MRYTFTVRKKCALLKERMRGPFEHLPLLVLCVSLHTPDISANVATTGSVKNKATTFCHFPLTTRAQMVHGSGHNNKTANPWFQYLSAQAAATARIINFSAPGITATSASAS